MSETTTLANAASGADFNSVSNGGSACSFVHLHVHSSYSLLEGAITLQGLLDLALADQMPAMALTDSNNLFGALEFSEKFADKGVQPIAGLQLHVDFADADPQNRNRVAQDASYGKIVLLAKSQKGFANLMVLSSVGFLDKPAHEAPHVSLEALAKHSEGLIALTGGAQGAITSLIMSGQLSLAEHRLRILDEIFSGNLYVEMQRYGLPREAEFEEQLLDLADQFTLPLVATNDVYFAKADDYQAHDALVCIAAGRTIEEEDRPKLTTQHYFKSRAEMCALFADMPEVCANSVAIARKCAARPLKMNPLLPRASQGADDEGEALLLRTAATEGLKRRLDVHGPASPHSVEDYYTRLDYELGIIEKMKFPGYFLIVADFIKWAKGQGIPVGPGRGSGAGSLVAYSLTITDIDPMRFGLFFERFLNPERKSMPDFDVDFCQERRDEVIQYVRGHYGNEYVAQIITFGTLLARGVMRDVGRVMGLPYGQVDRLTKFVPQIPGKTVSLAQVMLDEPQLKDAGREDLRVGTMLNICQKLEGLHRHASTHAAGLVIGDRPLQELVPIYRDPKSDMRVTQYNMKWVESAGLVKFDFLGLKTLTVMAEAAILVRKRGIDIDLSNLPLDDKKTFELLTRGETIGVFQVESGGMRRALLDMRPDRFEDLIALVALYRPGPMANIPIYCARKHGTMQTEYLHPELEPILKETFGVITYQEQVMQIARDLAGYSFGEADILRRAMGKKVREEMASQEERFTSGALKYGLKKNEIEQIFEACAKFADYGFNKSHSAPYALITYQTAYLKANYPVEFMAALMNQDIHNTDKLADFKREASRLGIDMQAPNINQSGVHYMVSGKAISYALAALKGVGKDAAQALVDARGDVPFTSLADFARRIPPRLVNKRTIEALAASGAFDCINKNRSEIFAGADMIMGEASRSERQKDAGQSALFGEEEASAPLLLPQVAPWTGFERLQKEQVAMGFFLSGHPLDDYTETLKRMQIPSFAEFSRHLRQGGGYGKLAGTVVSYTEKRTKKGNKIGILVLSDRSGQFESVMFSETVAEEREKCVAGTALIVTVAGSVEGDEVKLRIQEISLLESAIARVQTGLSITVDHENALPKLHEILSKTGNGQINLAINIGNNEFVDIKLSGKYDVSQAVAGKIRLLEGIHSVAIV